MNHHQNADHHEGHHPHPAPGREGEEVIEIIEIIEIIDIEEFAKTKGHRPPKAKKYRIKVDKTYYTVEVPEMTGRQILTLAGKTPVERWMLNQKHHGGQITPIELDQVVDFCAPGLERFMTLPKDQTEGRENVRRQFELPEEDRVALEASGHEWEAIEEPTKARWTLIHGLALPAAFTAESVSVAISIPQSYPSGALDMAYFQPPVLRRDGRKIPNTEQSATIDGGSWQRWSRHYTPTNPWKSGEYNVMTHFHLVRSWIDRELSR